MKALGGPLGGPWVALGVPWGLPGGPLGALGGALGDPGGALQVRRGALGAPCKSVGGPLGRPGTILVPFWEHFEIQNEVKDRQKNNPESDLFLGDVSKRFRHPWTHEIKHFQWTVVQNHTVHVVGSWRLWASFLA